MVYSVAGLAAGYYLAEPVLGALFGLDEKYNNPKFVTQFKTVCMIGTTFGATYFQNPVVTGCTFITALLLYQQNKLFMERLHNQRIFYDQQQESKQSIWSSTLPFPVANYALKGRKEVGVQATITSTSMDTSTDHDSSSNRFIQDRTTDLQNRVYAQQDTIEKGQEQLRKALQDYNKLQQKHAQELKVQKDTDAAKRKDIRQSWKDYTNYLKRKINKLSAENQKLKNNQPVYVEAFTVGDLNNLIKSVGKTTTNSSSQTDELA